MIPELDQQLITGELSAMDYVDQKAQAAGTDRYTALAAILGVSETAPAPPEPVEDKQVTPIVTPSYINQEYPPLVPPTAPAESQPALKWCHPQLTAGEVFQGIVDSVTVNVNHQVGSAPAHFAQASLKTAEAMTKMMPALRSALDVANQNFPDSTGNSGGIIDYGQGQRYLRKGGTPEGLNVPLLPRVMNWQQAYSPILVFAQENKPLSEADGYFEGLVYRLVKHYNYSRAEAEEEVRVNIRYCGTLMPQHTQQRIQEVYLSDEATARRRQLLGLPPVTSNFTLPAHAEVPVSEAGSRPIVFEDI